MSIKISVLNELIFSIESHFGEKPIIKVKQEEDALQDITESPLQLCFETTPIRNEEFKQILHSPFSFVLILLSLWCV